MKIFLRMWNQRYLGSYLGLPDLVGQKANQKHSNGQTLVLLLELVTMTNPVFTLASNKLLMLLMLLVVRLLCVNCPDFIFSSGGKR